MDTFDKVIERLKNDADALRDLSERLMVTDAGDWEALKNHLSNLGAEMELKTIKEKIREIANKDGNKENELIQEWFRNL